MVKQEEYGHPQLRPVQRSGSWEAAVRLPMQSAAVDVLDRGARSAGPVRLPQSASGVPLGTAIVAAYLAAAYFAVYKLLPGHLSADQYLYVAQPLIWSGLGLISFLLWRRLPDRPALRPFLVGLAVIAGLFQLSIWVGSGILLGFGHSPLYGPAVIMAKNAAYLITLLAGLEMARAYLLHGWSRINAPLAFGVVALLFAAVTIAPAQFDPSVDRQAALQTAGSLYMPAVADSVMATFLASFGGPLVALGYMLMIRSFEWFSPILPNLDWTMTAFVRSLAPVVAMLIVRDIMASWSADDEDAEEAAGGMSPLWLIGAVLIVAIIWLNAGMFGVKPQLVSGISMAPALEPYDVIILDDVKPEELKVGDMVRYLRDGVPIVHRIVEIPVHVDGRLYAAAEGPLEIPEGSVGPVFITKGDANNVADPPVYAAQIEGKVIYTIPKVGWLPAQVKKLFGLLP